MTLIENFASHAAVQEFVDVKPDWTRPEIFGHRMRQVLQRPVVFGSDKPVLCILPYGLDRVELRRRGRQVQDLQPIVLLQRFDS